MSYPWDTEALGLALTGVASGVGTASVVCGVWEHEDPLTTAALFAPAVSIVPQEQTLTSPRSWGYESVALVPSICWALKPLQTVPFTTIVRGVRSTTVTASMAEEARRGPHFSL